MWAGVSRVKVLVENQARSPRLECRPPKHPLSPTAFEMLGKDLVQFGPLWTAGPAHLRLVVQAVAPACGRWPCARGQLLAGTDSRARSPLLSLTGHLVNLMGVPGRAPGQLPSPQGRWSTWVLVTSTCPGKPSRVALLVPLPPQTHLFLSALLSSVLVGPPEAGPREVHWFTREEVREPR